MYCTAAALVVSDADTVLERTADMFCAAVCAVSVAAVRCCSWVKVDIVPRADCSTVAVPAGFGAADRGLTLAASKVARANRVNC